MNAAPGSLFIVGFPGHAPDAELLSRLSAGRLGGVIFFTRNWPAPLVPADFAALVRTVAAAAEPGAPPPVVSIDQEGGRVQRLRAPLTVWPPMARLRGRGAELAERVGYALGAELAALGVNLNYAPVLDVHTNPQNPIIGDRAFGATAAEVIQQALALWRGMERAGVRGCGKHFPGHGDTAQDSHLTLPVVDRSEASLRAVELLPFAAAVPAGVPAIMTAHVVYPQVDPRPATLSSRWLGGVLRGELGFDGVIISDDLEMQAVCGAPVGEVVLEALMAGCDAFLVCHEAQRWQEAEDALLQAARRSAAVQARIEEAAGRMRRLRHGLRAPVPDLLRLEAARAAGAGALAELLG